MTPTEAYLAGLATLPVIALLIALARPRPVPGAVPPPVPKSDPFTMQIEATGFDKIEADLARVTKAANATADRLREVAELGERIARKPDTNT